MATDPKVIDGTYISEDDVKTKAELMILPPPAALTVARPPEQVVAEAKMAADELIKIVKAKPKPFMLHGDIYLQFEDWQTVGKFYGATVKVTETKYIEYGTVKGFEAKAVVLNSAGLEISGAEAMCLDDEKNWKTKPLFQLKSMAQTRASSKALRNVFAWVVVLAGYKPTPAEEMDGVKPRKEQEAPSLERFEGVIEKATLSGGGLWFYIGETIFHIPPMKGRDMKEVLAEANGTFVELDCTLVANKEGKKYQQVKEIVKFEPPVPF